MTTHISIHGKKKRLEDKLRTPHWNISLQDGRPFLYDSRTTREVDASRGILGLKDIRPRRLLRDGQRVGGMMSHLIPRDKDGAYRIDNRIDKKILW